MEGGGRVPLSSDPAKRQAQLANLRPGAGAGDGGLQRALGHGAYAVLRAERIEQREREIFDALAADAPLRSNGELPAHDGAIVSLLAQTLCRLDDVTGNIRDLGVFEQRGKRKGQLRPVVDVEARLRREAAGYLEQLGMTPAARAKLGVDLVRTVDLATAMSSGDVGAMRAAGVIDAEAVEDGSDA